MENLSEHKKFFRELLKNGTSISFWELDPGLAIIDSNASDSDILLDSLLKDGCKDTLFKYLEANETKPLVLYDGLNISWIVTSEITNEILSRVYMIGPVLNAEISMDSLRNDPRYKNNSEEEILTVYNSIKHLPLVPLTNWLQFGTMLYFTINNERITFSDFIYQEMTITNQEKDAPNIDKIVSPGESTWLMEQMIMEKIEKGSSDYKEIFSKFAESSNAVDIVNSEDEKLMRQTKNYVISFITLATRAAIRGGLDVETAYAVGNNYIYNAELSQSKSELINLNNSMFADFVRRVKKVKEESGDSKLIRQCTSYIDLHIEEKITASDLSKHLHYSSSYISHKFKDETGMTILDYVQNQKIEAAKKLLDVTNDSVNEIALNLSFCNSSHFIDLFKKKTGMTPAEYRNR